MRHNTVRLALAFNLAVWPWLTANAGSLQVGPTRVSLADPASVESLTVRNAGDADMIVQLEKFAWHQREGLDEYEPTDELIATPPVFRVAAGGVQTIRIGVRSAAESDRQRAYRVFVREVPSEVTNAAGGLRVALRIGVPVFQGVSQAPADSVSWIAARQEDGRIAITANNAADAYVHVSELQLCPASGADCMWRSVEGAYVLAHGSHAWQAPSLRLAEGSPRLRLLVKTDDRTLHREIEIKR